MKNIILDTDIGPDCEDAAAVAIVNILADKGKCNILGISHCTSNPYGAGTIDAINAYYGRKEVNISTYPKAGFLDAECNMKFNRYITSNFPNRYKENQPEPAVRMFRRLLSSQPDKSVHFIAIGPLVNLSDLLNSLPDEYSDLCGRELVQKKVNTLYLMAGAFRQDNQAVNDKAEKECGKRLEDYVEWNVAMDVKSAINVAENWNTAKVYLGWEIGISVVGGNSLRTKCPKEHPVRIAYELYTGQCERFTWDSLIVEYAILGENNHFKTSAFGKISFDDMGRSTWYAKEGCKDCFIKLAQSPEKIIFDFDQLLTTAPIGGFPNIKI